MMNLNQSIEEERKISKQLGSFTLLWYHIQESSQPKA